MENIDLPQPVKLILDQGRKHSLGIMNFRLAWPGHRAQHHPDLQARLRAPGGNPHRPRAQTGGPHGAVWPSHPSAAVTVAIGSMEL